MSPLLWTKLLSERNQIQTDSGKKGFTFFSLIIVKILVNDKALICFVTETGYHTGVMHKFVT